MNDSKKARNGILKRGLVLSVVCIMALGMVACGGKDKNAAPPQPGVKNESAQPETKNRSNLSADEKEQDSKKTPQKKNSTGVQKDREKDTETKKKTQSKQDKDKKNSDTKKSNIANKNDSVKDKSNN